MREIRNIVFLKSHDDSVMIEENTLQNVNRSYDAVFLMYQ